MKAQVKRLSSSQLNISKSKSKDLNSKIEFHNQLELLPNIKKKIAFLSAYENKAKQENHNSHLLFTTFLKGETFFWAENLPEASKNYHRLLLLAKEKKDLDNEFLAYSSLMYFHLKTQEEDSVNLYMAKAKKLLNATNSAYYKIIYSRRLSGYYIEKEDYINALDRLLYINKFDVVQKSVIHCNALTNIGWIYEHLSYPERAKIYYLKALKVAKEIKSKRHLNFCKLKLAHIELFNLNNPEKALEEYKRLEPDYRNTNEYKEGVLYGAMGYAYTLIDKKETAFLYLKKSQSFFEKSKDSVFLCLPYTYLTHYYYKYQKFEKAVESGETSLQIIRKKNLFDARKLILLNKLAASYKALGNKEKAYDLLLELNNIKTKLELKKNNIAFVENQYENQENQERLEIIELKNQILSKNRKQYIASILIIGIFSIIILFLYQNRQKTNKKLREIDTLKTNFFTNISHEFRTPLTLISTPLQVSLEDPNLSEEKRNHFQIAQKNTQKLSALIDQLLELSKIDSGSRRLTLEKIRPTQLISAWNESFVYLGEQKNIEFNIEVQDKEIEAWCDQEALENITTNLLGNAIKYTPENGKIRFKATIKNKLLKIEVANTGKGLTKSQLKTIFNRFYQTDGHSEGAGVGLSLVKELTELHGGHISANSKFNEWTIFTTLLSLDKNKFKNADIRKEKSSSSNIVPILVQNKVILQEKSTSKNTELPILLVVEDNADMRTVLSDTFKKEYQIILAENGEKGIAMAIEHIPDIIVSDLMMPIKDGVELTKVLKNDERTSHIPILLLTAKAGDENALTGIDVGADDYITKPFNQKILRSKIRSLILLRQKLQSRYSQEIILKPTDIAITSLDERFLEKVQEVLDNQLIESSFTIEDFSSAVHMSRMQLHRKLKALTGLSTSEFIRSQRLKLAATILKKSDINVSEVGYSVGFNDHAYFSKCFREAYNCTPSDFAVKK